MLASAECVFFNTDGDNFSRDKLISEIRTSRSP